MIYDYFETRLVGTLILASDEQGLRCIKFNNSNTAVTIGKDWKRNPAFFKKTKMQLAAYFNGELRKFDLPLAPEGTAFQQRVWEILQKIPYGRVATYQWVADRIGNPRAVRAVGGAIGKNRLAIVIPCHRVIGSNGSLTGFGGGLDRKQCLLELEGYEISL